MPRPRVVSRTITVTIASLKCVVIDTDKVCTIEVRLPTAHTPRSLIKAVEKDRDLYLPQNVKVYGVNSIEVVKQKYSMSEREFMLAATPIDTPEVKTNLNNERN